MDRQGEQIVKLPRSIQAWGTPDFGDELKAELGSLDAEQWPLQQALCSGNYVLDEPPTVMINGVDEHEDAIVVRVGLFFAGINAGSCCNNDPTPVEPHSEYCVVQLTIDRATGETGIALLDT